MYLDSDRRPALTPQLALRVAMIGGIALVAFAVIFFRLWYLQVLSGDKYLAEANNNRVREIKVQAPRGKIVDRNGRVLVDNRTGLAVKISPDKLPEGPGQAAQALQAPRQGAGHEPEAHPQERGQPAQGAAVLERDGQAGRVPAGGLLPARAPGRLPGRDRRARVPAPVPAPPDRRPPVRHGRRGDQGAAQGRPRYRGVALGDRVGPVRHRVQYDRFLRGRNGASRVQVDALGNPQGRAVGARAPAGPPAAPVGGPRTCRRPASARSPAARAAARSW